MKLLLSLRAASAGARAGLLVALMGGAALAQPTATVNPEPAPAQSSAKDEPPPGACKPIGLTVSGEIVFPMECKEFIERQKALDLRPAAAETKPARVEDKPAAPPEKSGAAEAKPAAEDEKPAAALDKPANAGEQAVGEQNNGAAPETSKSAVEPVETGSLPKDAAREPLGHIVGPPGCTHFRTYDATSGTYRTYDGQSRKCREGRGKLVRKK
jgi:hypothetical protein